MISRRIIRVKVMQTIYTAHSLQDDVKAGEPAKILEKQLNATKQLLVYVVYLLTEVAKYAEHDAKTKANKHLPTEADLSINTKIAGNEIVWKLLENASFNNAVQQDSLPAKKDSEFIRQLYYALCATETYKNYITVPNRNKDGEKAILDFLVNDIFFSNEVFEQHLNDLFFNWHDDCDMIFTLVQLIVAKPGASNFSDLLSTDKKQFAFSLLSTTLDKKEQLFELIKPKLKNWDVERVAVLDLILLQMGLAELLFFETIPAKVTINEYIDLAKEYSTPQSGHFVNGILDNIHKDLVSQNKLHKVDFRKK
jgi:transcription antitermination protein NusB